MPSDDVTARHTDPQFEFGVFDFDEFADWLAVRHTQCTEWLIETARDATEDEISETLRQAYNEVQMSAAIDGAYLAMLALALGYSIKEDLMDGDGKWSPDDLIESEPLRRAKYMLTRHADQLHVQM